MSFGPLVPITTMTGRIAAVLLGCAVLLLFLVAARRYASPSFYFGFMVSAGLFLSFDMILFHWVFRLHRITSGPEANVIEPALVMVGIGLTAYGLMMESRQHR